MNCVSKTVTAFSYLMMLLTVQGVGLSGEKENVSRSDEVELVVPKPALL